jgi:hypothetical protein
MSLSPLSETSELSPGPPTREGRAAAGRSFVRWPARLMAALAFRFMHWCRDDGYWYLTSMAAHAIGLVCLAMISLAIPRAGITAPDKAPAFDEADVDHAPADALVDRFDVGETPLDPSELTTELLSQFKAMPIASQTAEFYDNSDKFEEAGGGTSVDPNGLNLGGLGGLNFKDVPGPAGRGGVGTGVGTSTRPGFGGPGEGYGLRGKGHREGWVGALGGTKAGERAVAAALNWLYRHQTVQGRWMLDFRHQCKSGTCSGPGVVQSDAAATAMALLPFLGAGQTHKSKGPYQQCIAKGIAWLIKQQHADGDLSGNVPQPMYSHGIAAIALCEAYGMTHDEHVGLAARKAVAFIERAQNQSTGGWRYEPGDTGDTSVFGWQIMALKSALLAGLPVNSITLDNAQKWLRSVAKGEHLGLYSYQPYREVTPTMTAVGMLCRQYLGIDPKDPAMLEGKRCLLENLPDGKLLPNVYYWYYATMTMHNFADADWDVWNRQMRRVLIESQDREGCATGSWDPEKPAADVWGSQGGRLMTTSFNALTLEVYYRYLPLFKTDSLVPGKSARMGFTKPVESKDTE